MKNNIKVLTISALFMLLFNGCGKKLELSTLPKSVEAIPVKTIFLSQAEVSGSVHSSGQFTTDDETMLSFKTGGIS